MLTIALLIFKGVFLPFPRAALPIEICVSVFALLSNAFGVMLGVRGNLTENGPTIFVGVGLVLVSSVAAIYFMWLQTYVLMLDLAFSAIYVGVNSLTVIVGLLCGRVALAGIQVRPYHRIVEISKDG